ncbi:hypothetical protein ACM640_02435 [Lactiplantibacillus plantarum]|jgi:hypothetical protein|uniref:hypothetical protein n=1 Tax=Lactiplantibacillus TaxID=2767842 RepID=UPI00092FEF8A|nr:MULTISPECIES: hypothetical protein [Lactiplantibacillus]MCB7150781.1 hypothetical protein [Lactiplantibacillus plantarum]MCB7169804.1 hypothetical protein [Lactiplantibacillus plantarum]MCG0677208.1 hypothetical protein [Lactiplantibacillus plantarum]MCG0820565.1 hypothetical protein [Lactiplantibacillus plantarum]MCG0880101.1 hypothetical protein [Lactiplantibacillus plantarum]
MYNESEIETALTYRNYYIAAKAYQEAEQELLTTIKFTTVREVSTAGNKKYRPAFLNSLTSHGIYYRTPANSKDGKWYFTLPDAKEVTDEDLFS